MTARFPTPLLAVALLGFPGALFAQQGSIPVPTFGAPVSRPAPTPVSSAPAAPPPTVAPTPAPGTPTLRDLESLLTAGQGPLRVNLVFPDVEEVDAPQLVRGAAVAQALALRGGDRPMIFSSARQPKDGAFNVLVGELDALRLYVPPEVADRTTHGLLRLQPQFGSQPALVVSGVSQVAVDEAILALGFANEKLPASAEAFIREVQLPTIPPFMRRTPIFPGSTRTFQDMLKHDPGALRLGQDGAIGMNVFFSAMVGISTDAKIQIDLHFLLRQRAFTGSNGLKILLNGEPAADLSAADISGAPSGGSAGVISVPVNQFLPGRNEIVFQPDGMIGQTAQPDTFAIYADSAVVFPRVEGNVPLPDLRTTTRTLFPLVGQPDGSEISVFVGSRSPEVIHAAWTFLAKLAQTANTLLYRAAIGFDRLDPRMHQIVIAPSEALPKEYRGSIAEGWLDDTPEESGNIEASMPDRVPSKNLQYVLQTQVQRLFPTPTPTPAPEDSDDERRVSDLRSACLASMPNPGAKGRWALILSALDPATLEKRTNELVRPEFWDRIAGVAILWNADPEAMHHFVPGGEAPPEQLAFADREVRLPLGESMSRNVWAALCGMMFVILVLLSLKLLRYYDTDVEGRKRKPIFGNEPH